MDIVREVNVDSWNWVLHIYSQLRTRRKRHRRDLWPVCYLIHAGAHGKELLADPFFQLLRCTNYGKNTATEWISASEYPHGKHLVSDVGPLRNNEHINTIYDVETMIIYCPRRSSIRFSWTNLLLVIHYLASDNEQIKQSFQNKPSPETVHVPLGQVLLMP